MADEVGQPLPRYSNGYAMNTYHTPSESQVPLGFARHHFDPAICLILFSNHTACACSWQFAAVGAIAP